MRREIDVRIASEPDFKKEMAKLSLHFDGQGDAAFLDVDATTLLKVSRSVPDLAQDFLCIASCIYAADKGASREIEEDRWTRHLAIEIPVEHVKTWSAVADELSDCIGFLTGDRWEISFRHGEKRLVQKRPRKQFIKFKQASGDAVCLFSGGLDSFIGAVDWFSQNRKSKLLLVGHYDGDVSGPKSDQKNLQHLCARRFPGRFELAQTRVGLSSGGVDTNFRSRSLLFIALGCYFAELLGRSAPVLIPENGPIALNFPLTPARRGSCSTRTVHPHFITSLNRVLARVGILNPIQNPYELKTKGEMVMGCSDQDLLKAAYRFTRSCAKSSRRGHWTIKRGPTGKAPLGCGICVPCLFRRAALHQGGMDDEVYGIPVEVINDFEGAARADVLALTAFLRRQDSARSIASGLLGNGQLPIDEISDFVHLVERMRSEVIVWLQDKGSRFLKNAAGL